MNPTEEVHMEATKEIVALPVGARVAVALVKALQSLAYMAAEGTTKA